MEFLRIGPQLCSQGQNFKAETLKVKAWTIGPSIRGFSTTMRYINRHYLSIFDAKVKAI